MDDERITHLLKKYKSPYVDGEIHSSETNKINKRNQRRLEKHYICEDLFSESRMVFSCVQKDFIHYLIDRFSDFKKLHGRAKNETIILAFIFYVKKIDDSRINLNNYSISKKYGLTDNVFKLVICRMCDDFIKNSPMIYHQTTSYDHEILSKNGGKL